MSSLHKISQYNTQGGNEVLPFPDASDNQNDSLCLRGPEFALWLWLHLLPLSITPGCQGGPWMGKQSTTYFFFSRGEGYYLLWGLTTLPGDRLKLSHLYCFATDVPVNCSLGFKDFQK